MHFRVILLILSYVFWLPSGSANATLPADCDCVEATDTIYVTNTTDEGPGSLRCAIFCANQAQDFNHIKFDLEQTDSIIYLFSSLPTLFGNVSITSDSIRITVKGDSLQTETEYGLRINGDNVVIYGLQLENFPNNAIDNYQGYKNIRIENNIIKNNGRLSQFGDGIDFRMARNCFIINNQIIGNNKDGLYIQAGENFTITGNKIVSNLKNGIYLYDSHQISLGDSCQSCENLISGNLKNGIEIIEHSKNIDIYNNIIGLDEHAEMGMPNHKNGISIQHSDSIRIGESGHSNYISGNFVSGIEIIDSSFFIRIKNNWIGYTSIENLAVPNGMNGIKVLHSNVVLIGGETQKEANFIGYSPNNVYIGDHSRYCSIRHNTFSCGVFGITIEPNSNEGITPANDIFIQDAYTLSGIDDTYIEIQAYSNNQGCITCQGNTFLSSTFTFTGVWQLDLDEPLQSGDMITVLKTDLQGNTSTFSKCVQFNCENFEVEIVNDNQDLLCEGSQLVLGTNLGTEFHWSTGETTPEITISESGVYSVTVLNEDGCASSDTIQIGTLPSPDLSIEPSETFSFCGNSAILKASGEGFFEWNDGTMGKTLEVFESGTYCVSLTNIYGCMVSDCITVHEGAPADARIEALGSTSFCNGEHVQLVASGGKTFYWSTGEYNKDTITIYQSGNYMVTVVNEDGCADTASQAVQVFPSVNATIQPAGSINICYGDSITLKASGGSFFKWNNGSNKDQIIVDELGIYFVTVTNEFGCEDFVSQTVSINPPVIASLNTSGPLEFCEGDSVWLYTEGINLDSTIWNTNSYSDSLLVKESGHYLAEIFSYGCSIKDSLDVMVYPLPRIDSILGLSWSFPDSVQEFSVFEPVIDYSYQWYVKGGTILDSDSTAHVWVEWQNDVQGEICVNAIDSNNCEGPPLCRSIDLNPLSMVETEVADLVLFPNPSSGKLNLKISAQHKWNTIKLEFYSPLGVKLFTKELEIEAGMVPKSLELGKIPAGIYWVKIYGNQQLLGTKKWVLNK